MRRSTHITWLLLVPAVLGCAASTPSSSGTITIADEVIDLQVDRCSLSQGSFRESLPDNATETLLRATGETADSRHVELTARRSRSTTAPHIVQTVEITIGDPTGDLEALVLYRGYDRVRDRWVEIDADAPSGRVEVSGPLMSFDGPRLEASGTVVRPDGGERPDASLQIHCLVDPDDTDVVATGVAIGHVQAAVAPTSRSAAFHASWSRASGIGLRSV